MKLFLTSSGLSNEASQIFLDSFNKKPNEITFYFIPNAADVEQNNQRWVTESLYQFSKLGINPIWYSIKNKTKELMESELADADVIWINGGNTFYLLDLARKTGFLEIVKDLVLNKNVIYGGTSAGSLLACKDIRSAGWADGDIIHDSHMNNFSALGFVDFLIFPHYDEILHKKDIISENKEKDTVYLIPDGTTIILNNAEITIIGPAEILN